MPNFKRSVPIYKLKFESDFIHRFAHGCGEILESDALTNGRNVRQFEEKFANFMKARHAVAVGSGTDALEVAFRALNVRGKEVIMPTNTFVATPIAARRAGADVVLLDIEDTTFSLNCELLERAINERTCAVVVVHIGGIISHEIEKLVSICRDAGVFLVEDAAHAHGSRKGNFRAGTIGTIGCFSFFPTKVMTSGEGGMIVTNDESLAVLMNSIREFGRDPNDSLICIHDGGNFKMTEFQGLLGCLEMERVRDRILSRNLLARKYSDLLANSTYRVVIPDQEDNSYYKVIVRLNGTQEKIRAFSARHGVSLTGEVYRYPIHEQPLFKDAYRTADYPAANEFSKTHICPPLYPELDFEDVSYVCEVLCEMKVA